MVLLLIVPLSVRAQSVPPRDAAAATIAAALADLKIDQALVAYDAYVNAVKTSDIQLLRPIARAELERAAQSADRELAADALERLARADDAAALSSLKRAAAADASVSRDVLAPLISLARLGDKDALARLGARLQAEASAETKVQVIQVLQNANASAQAPAVAAMLDDPAPNVRAAAVVAVGALRYREAIPKLKTLYGSDLPTVRLLAGVALTRFGDTVAESAVAELLKSEQPEMLLMAGEALQSSKSAQWMPLVKELRNNRNPVYEVRAAAIVACCDPAWSKGVLIDALGNPMAILRFEAARVLEATDLADARVARRMLGIRARSSGPTAPVPYCGWRPSRRSRPAGRVRSANRLARFPQRPASRRAAEAEPSACRSATQPQPRTGHRSPGTTRPRAAHDRRTEARPASAPP